MKKQFISGKKVSRNRAFKGLGDRKTWAADHKKIVDEMKQPFKDRTKTKLAYMHTISGCPAAYVPGEQVCYATRRNNPVRLVESLRQIRKEQKASMEWRKAQGFPDRPTTYGYTRVILP